MFLRTHKKVFKLIVCIKKQSTFLIQSQLGNIFDFFRMAYPNNHPILNIVGDSELSYL